MEQNAEKLFLRIMYSVENSRISFVAYPAGRLGDNERQYLCDGMCTFGSELSGFLNEQGVESVVEPHNKGMPGIMLKTRVPVRDVERLIRKAEEVKYRIAALHHYHKHGVSSMTERKRDGEPRWHERYMIEFTKS